jgi:hypothetical protein
MPGRTETQTGGINVRMTNSLSTQFARLYPRHVRSRLARWAIVSVLGAVSVLVAVTPGSATAASLPASLARFANCPVDNPAVTLCLFSKTSSTTFDIGSTTVSSTSPAKISLGLIQTGSSFTAVLPDNGTQALTSPAIPLPGGLSGIPGAPDGGVLQVTVTPQLVALPTVNLSNLLTGDGPGLTLPIDVLVTNPLIDLLGSNCTLADAADPITLNLTTGTTDPPPPNTPITGALGTVKGEDDGVIKISGMSLVDNAFAVPGADNCGPGGSLDEILDIDKSLPSAAGSNSAILSGTSYTAPASLIRSYLG